MTAFTAEWLAMREPIDRHSHSPRVLAATRRWADRQIRDGRALRVVDLGAGTGSNLRRLAPVLPGRQAWTLIDHDPDLLAVAANHASSRPSATLASTGALQVRTLLFDLAPRSVVYAMRGAQLITASAFLDLVSAAWCRSLVRAAARPGRALYAPLTCDGRISIDPPDVFDLTMNALFARHQGLDKGFGPALGPTAASALARFAAATGAVIIAGRSDWRLASNERSLMEALVEHRVATAREMSPRHSVAIGSWAQRRSRQLRTGQLRIVVGHRDLLATWPRFARRLAWS